MLLVRNLGRLLPVIVRCRPILLLGALVTAAVLATSACDGSPAAPTPPPVSPPQPPPPQPPPSPPPPPPPGFAISRILAFGDSITEGESTGTFLPRLPWSSHNPETPGVPTSYPAKLQGLVNALYTANEISIFNGGKGGERASEGLSRMLDLIDQLQPEVMILMTGVNDLNGGESVAETGEHLETLVKEAMARGVPVFLSTLSRQIEGRKRADAPEEIEPYNELVAAIALDEGATLVDIYPHITEALLTPDGLHITEMGNEVLAGVYLEALKVVYELPPAVSLPLRRAR